MKKLKQIIILFVIAGCLGAFFYFDLGQYHSLEYIKEQQVNFSEFYTENTLFAISLYMAVYIVSTGLSLPGAAFLTLLGGALFGLLVGTIVVSFASTIGATLAFLVSRLLLRDYVQNKLGSYLKPFNDGIKKDGGFYLFTLRLVPAVPFFVINLVMGLTPIKAVTFYGVSQLGMLAGTVVFVNAGTQLAQLESLSGIVSPEIDKDNGYFWWFDFNEEQNIWDVFGREKDFEVPLGATANLHCKIFSNKIYKEYGNVLPDIFVSYCTESVFSFLTAAVKQKFIIANDVLYYHGENKGVHSGADGQTLAYGAAWDRLFPGAPRSIAEIVNDPEAAASGFGYEEWVPRFLHKMDVPDDKPYLIHDEKQYDEDGFSIDGRLKNFIKKNVNGINIILSY